MPAPIKVLMVEDVAADAGLVARALKKGGIGHELTRVDTEVDFLRTLAAIEPDVILSDFSMPHFDGMSALAVAREHAPDIPFIFVSGTIGEEIAIESLKRGAVDYILKTNLKRLAPAVERALQDVRERRARLTAERQLNDARVLFELFMRYLPGAAFIKDWRGRYQFVNWSWEDIHGKTMAEVLGRTDESLWPELAAQFDRNEQLVLDKNDVLRSIESFPRADGTHQYMLHRFPILDRSGDPLLVGGISIDFTDRLRAENALRESEERFRDLLEFAPDAMVIADAGGQIKLVNAQAEALFGYQRSELLDQRVELLLPSQIGEAREQRADYRPAPPITTASPGAEPCGRRKDGTEFPVEVSRAPLQTQAGRWMLNAVRDVTERRIQERKIARLNRVYAVLSGINSLIVRARDRQELFNEACRIAVDEGGFGMAWIGQFDAATRDITPVASAGVDADLVASLKLSSREDVREGLGLAGQSVRSRQAAFCNDIVSAPDVGGGGRTMAIKRGYRSLMALPLLVEGSVAGVLSLFAKECDFFNDDELRLLTELAGDISFALEHIAKHEKLNYLAYYDELTGLPNRTLLQDILGRSVRRARDEKVSAAVILCDVNRFSHVNATLGRHAGDSLLREIGQRLKTAWPDPDNLARLSGNCFGGIVANFKDASELAHLVKKPLADVLAAPFVIDGQEFRVSVTVGIAVFPSDGEDADTLLRNAEAALKKAKAGGEKYLFYHAKMNAAVAETLVMENKLRHAIEREEFILHYQPKVDLATGAISGLEALIRWNEPNNGLVPPARFIPLLEETGMILEVGAWAIRQSLADYHAWQAQRLNPPRIAVNVSSIQLRQRDFVDTVRAALADSPVTAHGLDLEITESLIMDDIEGNTGKLKALRDMGVNVAIDDFGTGYSSLRYLARLPVNLLKIDRSFIHSMTQEADSMAIVSTIISLAHSLNMKVIAEGVETDEQSRFLKLLKCDEMQGYLFSRPLPMEQITSMLTQP